MLFQGRSECASDLVDDPGVPIADDAHEVELLMQSLSAKGSGEPQTQIDRAVRALVYEVVTGMRFLAQEEYRHGQHLDKNGVPRKNSVTLRKRLLEPHTQLPFHGHANSKSAKSNRPQQEGDEVNVLFNLVLEKLLVLNKSGFIPRMAQIPKGAVPQDFHRTNWRKFTKGMTIGQWSVMPHEQKYQHLHAWLFKKFTLDPQNKSMIPGSYEKWKPRNDACWEGFWMTDRELNGLVREVLDEERNFISSW